MSEWRSMRFGDLGTLFDGPHATPTRRTDGPYFLNIASLRSGRLDLASSDHVSRKDFEVWTRRVTPQADDLLFSYETRLGEAALMPAGVEACLGRRMALMRPDVTKVDPRFLLYYYLSSAFQSTISERAVHGATVSRIGIGTMPEWPVCIPDLRTQRRIADLLGSLDEKIACNDRVVTRLFELQLALVDSSLTRGSTERNVAQVAAFHNRRRVPLSSREREQRRGAIPYYGAAGRLDYVDAAIFDEPLVLVGEDGTVIRDGGRPVIQYVWGPSWVNNHAHVLTGREFSTELLRLVLHRTTVSHLVTGAVQPKISMGNLRTLAVAVPDDAEELDPQVQVLAGAHRSLTEESTRLAVTRDELLQGLLSGNVRLRDEEVW